MPENFTTRLSSIAFCAPHNPALIYDDGMLSFAELDLNVRRLATFFHDNGVKRGDVVSLRFFDERLLALALLAVARLGATNFSVPHTASRMQQEAMSASVNSRICISDTASDLGFDSIILVTAVILKDLSDINESAFDLEPIAPWLIITGSGSTGLPKLIPISHDLLLRRINLYNQTLGPGYDDRATSLLSLELPSAKNQMLSTLFAGAAYCVLNKTNQPFGAWCCEKGVSIIYATAGHLNAILQISPAMLSSVRAIVPAGSTIAEPVRQKIADRFGDVLYVRYGTTETGPISDATPREQGQVSGTVGKPLDGVEVQIVSGTGEVFPDGQVGRIRIASPGLAERYLGQDDYTRNTFRDGWFYPGDIGKIMSDGQIVHLGRADDMMIMNGVNIFPAEIETTMLSHPAVACAMALPVKHPIFQEVPLVAIQLNNEVSASEADLKAFASEMLGPRAPRQVVILPHIPMNPQGKPDRNFVKELLMRNHGIEVS